MLVYCNVYFEIYKLHKCILNLYCAFQVRLEHLTCTGTSSQVTDGSKVSKGCRLRKTDGV